MAEIVTISGETITADLLLWRIHGAAGQALVEELYALNPGLAGLGPVLPLGTEVMLPEMPARGAVESVTVVTLFG